MRSICHLQRKKRPGGKNFSLEQIFADVRKRLSDRFTMGVWIAPHVSNGLFRRLHNSISAGLNRADVFHVTGDINYVTSLLPRSRTVLTILDCGILDRKRGLRRFIIWLFWFQLPVWRSRLVTVISDATKTSLHEQVWCRPEKIRVIPVAISSAFVKATHEFNHSSPLLLQVGTAPNKNLDRVIEAIAGSRYRLRIVGPLDNATRANLANTGISFEQLENLPLERLVSCYCECDVLVFASTFEGFGMPILEANATGRVVVTSNVTSMPEVAGDAACYVNPFDVGSIRAGIDRVVEDHAYRDGLIEAGFQNVRRFDADVIARQYGAVYEEIVSVR